MSKLVITPELRELYELDWNKTNYDSSEEATKLYEQIIPNAKFIKDGLSLHIKSTTYLYDNAYWEFYWILSSDNIGPDSLTVKRHKDPNKILE